MQKVDFIPGLPEKRAAHYQLDGFDPPRYARVVYVPQESKSDRAVIEVQAFEVDASGNFVSWNGMPSRTPGTQHSISKSGIGDTHTLQPGWVRVVGDYAADTVGEGVTFSDVLPATGQPGDKVYIEPYLYRWDIGIIESTLQEKAKELAGILRGTDSLANFDL